MDLFATCRTNHGILIRDVADANSRYMLGMLPYTGKADQPDPTFHITGAANIVKHLVEPYANSGRNVTADRLYTSVELAEELLQKNLTYVGTIMTNRRHLPEEAKSVVGRQEHSSQFYWSDGVMVVSYAALATSARSELRSFSLNTSTP